MDHSVFFIFLGFFRRSFISGVLERTKSGKSLAGSAAWRLEINLLVASHSPSVDES